MKQFIKVILLTLFVSLPLFSSSLRVEPEVLTKNLSSYTILDTRDTHDYTDGHIKGALSFPVGLTYEHIKIDGKLTSPVKMQKIIQDLGLSIDTPIVIYDDGTFFDASRLFWTLEVYGFTNVKLLNTGYTTWESLLYPTSTETQRVTKSNYIAKVNSKYLATKFSTQIATKNPNHIIIDARPDIAYLGKKSSAKRFGHIPKALNYPAAHNIENQKLKTIDDLKGVYSDIDKTKKVVLYCAVGRIAATNYFALRELDYDVSNYDASWKEWGNDDNLPITNPSENKK